MLQIQLNPSIKLSVGLKHIQNTKIQYRTKLIKSPSYKSVNKSLEPPNKKV